MIQNWISSASGMRRALKWNHLEWQGSFKNGENGAKLIPSEILTLMKHLSFTGLEVKQETEITILPYLASLKSKKGWNGTLGTTTEENQENKQQSNSLSSLKIF